jgi:endoplasmic reticulum-Golgi intermediate compartment protein 2
MLTIFTGMNLSHVISEFSFGPYYPDIAQPLDYSFETTQDSFVAFQYFITVVPTAYIAPRSRPLHTHQYSVTHYIKEVAHGRGTPGIFFKYDIDPVALEIHQRTTSLTQFLVRIVGVIGGVWVCFGWGIKVATKVSQKAGITSDDDEPITAEVTGMSSKKRWRGSNLGSLRRRANDDGGSNWSTPLNSPYSGYSGQPTPASPYATFSTQGQPASPSPYSPFSAQGAPHSPYQSSHPPSRASAGFPASPGPGSQFLAPNSPYTPSHFPASPLPNQSGFPSGGLAPPSPNPYGGRYSPSPVSSEGGFAAQQAQNSPSTSRPSSIVGTPPPKRASSLRNEKKED